MCMVNLNVLNHLFILLQHSSNKKKHNLFSPPPSSLFSKRTCLPPKFFFSMVFFAHGHFFFSRLNFFLKLFRCVLQGCNNMQQQSQLTSCLCFSFQMNLLIFLIYKVLVHGILFLFTNVHGQLKCY